MLILPYKVEKPWGDELVFALSSNYAGKVIRVKQGHKLSLQYHVKKDETIYVYNGKIVIQIESTQCIAGEGCSIPIGHMTKHRVTALEDSVLFEVSTPELDDVKRLEDDYGRAIDK